MYTYIVHMYKCTCMQRVLETHPFDVGVDRNLKPWIIAALLCKSGEKIENKHLCLSTVFNRARFRMTCLGTREAYT